MTVVSFTAIHPKPGANWEDLQKHLKRGSDLVRKHDAENVTTLVSMAAGTATGTLTCSLAVEAVDKTVCEWQRLRRGA
jgi:hypothetical protein